MNLAHYALDKVAEFRKAAGLSIGSGDNVNHKLHHALFAEEYNELSESRTLADKADSYADQLVVIAGYFLDCGGNGNWQPVKEFGGMSYYDVVDELEDEAEDQGIYLNAAFDIAHQSNMTKFTDDFSAITQAIEDYLRKGIAVEAKETGGLWAVFSVKDQFVNGKDYPQGKLLKPATYNEPDWSNKSWII